MKFVGGFVMVAAFAASSSGAASQTVQHDAQKTMLEFAKCSIRMTPRRDLEALDLPFPSRTAGVAMNKLWHSKCLRGNVSTLRLPKIEGRSAIYAALYVKDFGAESPIPEGQALIEYPISEAGSDKDEDGYRQSVLFGDCAARAAPHAARNLLLAEVASANEDAAIAEFSPFLGACVPDGSVLKISKSMLRFAIAEPLYRMTKMQQYQSAAGEVSN